ncbi:MAG: hypothetical protein WAW11_01975, partial [Patescibacteria group bacterium]
FVKLDEEIHGLAHISQLGLSAKEKITDLYQSGEVRDFEVVNISPSEHRLGLKLAGVKSETASVEEVAAKKAKKAKEKAEAEEVKEEVKEETTEAAAE